MVVVKHYVLQLENSYTWQIIKLMVLYRCGYKNERGKTNAKEQRR